MARALVYAELLALQRVRAAIRTIEMGSAWSPQGDDDKRRRLIRATEALVAWITGGTHDLLMPLSRIARQSDLHILRTAVNGDDTTTSVLTMEEVCLYMLTGQLPEQGSAGPKAIPDG